MGSPKHLVPYFHAVEPVDHASAVSEAQRRTYERIGLAPDRETTVLTGIRACGPGPGRDAARAASGSAFSPVDRCPEAEAGSTLGPWPTRGH